MSVLAIDPGPMRSAWLTLQDGKPLQFGIWNNDDLLDGLRNQSPDYSQLVIEKIEGFGMAVGAEVFETVYWSGQFAEAAYPLPVSRIGRKAVKLHLCGNPRAKD